jgi:PPOX class probable F420-dependent enzyme
MTALPELARALADGANFATVSTIEPDGGPQGSVVWVKRDGEDILFSTIKGRRKYANLIADGRVSVLIADADDPYRYAEIRGTATITDDPQAKLIEELSQKYTGQSFGTRPGEERVIVRVSPAHVVIYE